MEYTIEEELVYFECERCNERCVTFEAKFRTWGNQRAFCGFCGACYVLYSAPDGCRWLERITMGEMYMPPQQWNELYVDGLNMGIQGETDRRTQYRSLWERLTDFIRNK